MSIEVVAVGASLGGLEAVSLLLSGLPHDFRPALVLAQHRMSDPDGLLVELLSEHSLLPVSEPDDREPIRPGHVYVAPSDYHLLIERGFFGFTTEAPVCHARPSIDVLFESAAEAYGASVVAIMLTGSNRDGADGARAVKEAGGRVLVQDPLTSLSPVAPRAVLSATAVDGIVDIEAMAKRLLALCVPGDNGPAPRRERRLTG